MDNHIFKRHNKTLLMYHLVCTVKYRKSLIHEDLEAAIKEICDEISQRFEIVLLEIGSDLNHIHFLVQSVPKLSVSKIVQIIKGNLSRQIFLKFPEIKKELWGGEFWTDGYYVNTVSQYGGKEQIERYIQNQGKDYKKDYKQIFRDDVKSQDLFDSLSG
jgi:REP element-mobilizing transposase RayT